MKLLFVRHGEPDYTTDSLTPKGHREAELLSDRLCKLDISDFYVSPLGRARQTAEPTLRKLNRTAEVLPWLQEFRGVVSDPTTGDTQICWNFLPRYWTHQPEFYDPEGWKQNGLMATGNAAEVYDETIRGFEVLLAEHGYVRDGHLWRCGENTHKTIVIFCHFAVQMAMFAHLLGVSPVILWHSFFLPASSVTEFITEEREKGLVAFRCAGMGDISHLYAAGEPRSPMGLFIECREDGDPRYSM